MLLKLIAANRLRLASIAVAVASMLASAAPAAPVDDAQKTEVRITSGDAVLAATLYRPAGARGNLPAVVVGHGSGRVTRQNTFWTNAALSAGLAALVYDKRGAGDSTGTFMDWEVETTPVMFQQLAADMAVAARWLATQPGIDRSRIGLVGGSQAGWVMPLAASQEPIVRFVIVGEGVPLPAGIEEIHSGYLDLVGNEKDPTLRQVTAADAAALNYDGPIGYDPAPVLERLEIPVLWIFGLYDGVIPVRQSIDRIGELQKAGRRNHSYHIFPFGNHNFRNVFTGEDYDVAEASRAWLRTIGIFDAEYLRALRNGTSEEHARIDWTIQWLEARANPPRLSEASLQGLTGRYRGGAMVSTRDGKLFFRFGTGPEREFIPLTSDLFALERIDAPMRVRFNRRNGVATSATFLRISGAPEENVREGS